MSQKWLIEIEVDDLWVEDGFNFTEDCCRSLEENLISFATEGEVKVRVVQAPNPVVLRKLQGYE